eukprot:gnl/TRDRNA2_/TRDRNA2_170812_c5_seq6.p1 gnl/TRDRNA2_/TRDRNA2_170812_c5~~gnl/TRDRNA2_/TRDRNA2_170812_c5_seq6.p1  ORF type:complete len:280 (+),score=74.61 gnl/TRDRNA2_/TRDRNA2_170812_c5_seq6:152-991(+)
MRLLGLTQVEKVMSGTTVRALKEQMAASDPTGKSKAEDVGLSLPFGDGDPTPLKDSVKIMEALFNGPLELEVCEPNQAADEVEAPAIQEVDVVVKHASHDGQVVVRVPENATLADVRAKVAAHKRVLVAEVRIVQRAGSSAFLPDTEELKGRREFAASGGWIQAAPMAAVAQQRMSSFPKAAASPITTGAAPPPSPSIPAQDVQVVVQHAVHEDRSVTVTVPDDCTMLDVRRAVLKAVGKTKLSEVKLVKQLNDNSFMGLKDDLQLKGRKEILAMGEFL